VEGSKRRHLVKWAANWSLDRRNEVKWSEVWITEVNWSELEWALWCDKCVYKDFSDYVLRLEYCRVMFFFTTWHMVSWPNLDWYFQCSLLCVLCCFILLCHGTIIRVTVFFCVIVLFIVTYFSVFFFLLCMYCFIFYCIYCTSTLPPGVNPIAVNKYLSI
jgi:hypothetical protein